MSLPLARYVVQSGDVEVEAFEAKDPLFKTRLGAVSDSGFKKSTTPIVMHLSFDEQPDIDR